MSRPQVLIVESDPRAAIICETAVAILGLDSTRVITAEAAIGLLESGPAAVIVAADLPGMDGLSLLQSAHRINPDRLAVLLARARPALCRSAPARLGLTQCVVKRRNWLTLLHDVLRPLATKDAAPVALTEALVADDSEPADLLGLCAAPDTSTDLGAQVIRFVGARFRRPRARSALDGYLVRSASTNPALFPAALRVVTALGGARIETLAAVIEASDAPVVVRAQAIEALAGRSEPAVEPLITKARSHPSVWIRHAAGRATLELAAQQPAQDGALLTALALSNDAALDIRSQAFEALARELDPAQFDALFQQVEARHQSLLRPAPRDEARLTADAVDALHARATSNAQPIADRIDALRTLSQGAPLRVLIPAIDEISRDDAVELQSAALIAAMQVDSTGAGILRTLAAAGHLDPTVRGRALRLVGVRLRSAEVQAIARDAFAAGPDALRMSALLTAIQLGDVGAPLLTAIARSPQTAAHLRVRALEAIATSRPIDEVLHTVQGALEDPDELVAATAYEIAARLCGIDYAPLIGQALIRSVDSLQHAIIDGALSIGEAGFGILAAVALNSAMLIEARLRALRCLTARYPQSDTKAIAERVKRSLPQPATERTPAPATSPRVRSAPTAPARGAPHPAGRNGVRTAGRPAVRTQRSPTVPPPIPAADHPTIVITEPNAPASTEARTEPNAPATLGRQPEPSSAADGPPPVHVPSPGSLPPAVDVPPAPDLPPAAKVPPAAKPRRAAGPRTGRGKGDATQQRRTARRHEPGSSGRTPAARPRHGQRAQLRVAPRSVAEARQTLLAALALGKDGFAALRKIVVSPTSPVDVRVTALRHLSAEFPADTVTPLIEAAMTHGPPKLQHAALACSMRLGNAPFAALRSIATDRANPVDVRLRALRQLAARRSRDDVRELVEGLLEDPTPAIQRAALEAVFPSMRHTQDDAIEASLINLLVEHPSAKVKGAAARALATYGTANAIPALQDHSKGLLTSTDLKRAAAAALERIKRRDPKARSNATGAKSD